MEIDSRLNKVKMSYMFGKDGATYNILERCPLFYASVTGVNRI